MNAPQAADLFQHVRVVMGIVVGLGVTRLLTGLARFVQHPGQQTIYPVHIGWALSMLLTLVHFWWWEFALFELVHWTFAIYLFVVSYATLLFLLCTLLFPDSISEYSGYEAFFLSRRVWFFSIFALTVVFDVADTAIKGPQHYELFAQDYVLRVPAYLALCAVAIWTPNRWFHLAFVVGNLIYQVIWIVQMFYTMP